jgi:hypothetical protein
MSHIRVARDVGAEIGRATLPLRAFDLFGDACAAVIVDVVDDELCAFFGKALGDRLAEA